MYLENVVELIELEIFIITTGVEVLLRVSYGFPQDLDCDICVVICRYLFK